MFAEEGKMKVVFPAVHHVGASVARRWWVTKDEMEKQSIPHRR